MDVLTLADRKALELLVSAYAEWRDCRDTVRLEGAFFDSHTAAGSPTIKAHPAVAAAADAWRRVRSMLVEFGLTPAARSKVSAAEAAVADPFDEWRNRRGPRGKGP